jgi:hypothetical protein
MPGTWPLLRALASGVGASVEIEFGSNFVPDTTAFVNYKTTSDKASDSDGSGLAADLRGQVSRTDGPDFRSHEMNSRGKVTGRETRQPMRVSTDDAWFSSGGSELGFIG